MAHDPRGEGAKMSDGRAYDDQGLPWLEAVDDEDGPRGVSARRMFVALLMILLAAAIVAGTFFWLGRRDAVVEGAPELIRAEPTPYKARPDDPGGLDVAGESETAFETSAGEDPDAVLDMDKLPQGVDLPPPAPAPGFAVEPVPKKIPPTRSRSPRPTTQPPLRGPNGAAWRLCLDDQGRTPRGALLSSRFPEVADWTRAWSARRSTARHSPSARGGGDRQTRAACAAMEGGGRKLPGGHDTGRDLRARRVRPQRRRRPLREARPTGYILFAAISRVASSCGA